MVRQVANALFRRRGYTLSIVAVMAIASALMTTVFAVVDGVLFKPLGYPDERNLVAVDLTSGHGPQRQPDKNAAVVSALSRAVPGMTFTGFYVGGGESGAIAWVQPNFFDVVGVQPAIGGFAPEDFDDALVNVQPRILTDRVVHSQFGGDRGAIGRVVIVDPSSGRGFRVVGVMPPGFVFPSDRGPVGFISAVAGTMRDAPFHRVVARLSPAVTAAGLEERLLAAITGVETRPERPPADRVVITPLGSALGAESRPLFAALLAAAAVLILIAALNASSLMAARSVDRRRELAIRRALGATRGDLARLVFSESCMLLAAGTATGLLVAAPLLRFVSALLPANVVLFRDAVIDWRVVLFSVVITAVLATLVVIWPFRLTVAGNSTLDQDRSGTSPARARGWRLVVSSQVALAMVLTVGGSLLVGSLLSVYAKTPPIATENVLTIEVEFQGMSRTVAREAPDRAVRVEALLERIRGVPGIEAVALTAYPLLVRAYQGGGFLPPAGVTGRPGAMVTHAVTSDFYRVLQPQLVEGRWPTDLELRTTAPVIVVSERLARANWPGAPAVGKAVTNHWKGRDSTSVSFTVVGVVTDVPWALWDEDVLGTYYGPYALLARPTEGTLLVRTSGQYPSRAEEILRVIEDADPWARAGRVASLESVFVDSVRPRRFRAWLFGAFAAASLFVVGLGIFGQLAMSTARRTREVGIRMACGATRLSIASLIVREQLVPVVAGVVVGSIVAAWAVRFVNAYLYQLTAEDPRVWAAAIALILATAIAGTLVPSLRATRVNPNDALRAE